MGKSKTLPLVLTALFTALTAIGAFLKIELPVVPFTFQVIIVMLAGVLLGAKWGTISQLLYVAIGLIGFPIFAHGGGPQYILQPTFGFLIGYIFAALLAGFIIGRVNNPSFVHFLIATVISLVPIYLIGTSYLYFAMNFWVGSPISISKAIAMGFTPFILFDLIKAVITSLIALRLYKFVPTISK